MSGRIRDTTARFGAISKSFHWLTFLLVASLFVIGWYMTGLPNTPTKFKVYALHKSIGLTVLALTALRIFWRFLNPSPEILGNPKPWERLAARAAHGLLYLLLLMLPLVGWVVSSAADFPIVWFGLVELPYLMQPDDAIRELTTTIHWTLGWVLFATLVIHVGAAVQHHHLKKDGTLLRMLPGDRSLPD